MNCNWISAAERLPETGELVLVAASGRPKKNIWLVDAYLLAGYDEMSGWIIDDFPEWEDVQVSFWMPLPEPPDHIPTRLERWQSMTAEELADLILQAASLDEKLDFCKGSPACDEALNVFFVRVPAEEKDAAVAAFGNVKEVKAEGVNGEFAFVTEKMTEAAFAEQSKKVTVKNRIRVEA